MTNNILLFKSLKDNNWKPGITARFALKFPFQSLETSIEKSKNWNGNSMALRAIFPGFQLTNKNQSRFDRFRRYTLTDKKPGNILYSGHRENLDYHRKTRTVTTKI